jgi:hypothetical protein
MKPALHYETENVNRIPVFFIVGRARSGTTLLRMILDTHPNILIPSEHPFIQYLYSKYHKISLWNSKQLMEFYNDFIALPYIQMMNIDKELLRMKISALEGKHNYGELCKTVYLCCTPFQKKEEIKIIGNKNIRFSLVIPFLIRIFPDAKFVFIIRDYRDNILSMKRVHFEAHIVSSLAYRWKYYNRKINTSAQKFSENFYKIRYEDLIQNPEHNIMNICKFLGVNFHPGMLRFYEKKYDYSTISDLEKSTSYEHSSLFRPITNEKLYTWKTEMSEKDIRKADTVLGKYAEFFSYERKYRQINLLTYLKCFPGIIYGRSYFIFNSIIRSMPYKIRLHIYSFLGIFFKRPWRRNRTITKK